MIARAKANPNELNYASPGIGTTPHLSGELFKIVAGIQMTHVPFSGAGPAIQAILSGTTQVAFAALPPAHPHIESGALKALAVTGAHRWFDLPEVPTMVELGYKDFISDTFQGFLAPVKTPPAIVELLAAKSIEILKTPEDIRAVAQQRLRGHRQRPRRHEESASTTKCRNGATSSPRPASSRSDRIGVTPHCEAERSTGLATWLRKALTVSASTAGAALPQLLRI